MSNNGFDPKAAVRRIKVGGGREGRPAAEVDYLQVRDRVLWVRTDHPDAHMESAVVHLDAQVVVMRALVTLSNGAEATGHGSAPMAAADAVEKAETAAYGRALACLGYGTQFALLEESHVVDTPVPVAGGSSPTAAVEMPEPAADLMPADPAELPAWFRARVAAMPEMAADAAARETVAKALAVELRNAGMADLARKAMYRTLTGAESGLDMDPRALALLAQLVTRADVLGEVGRRALAGPAAVPAAATGRGRANGNGRAR